MNNDCTLYMKGGLGNQLFQYATAYSYAKKHNKKLLINIDQFHAQPWGKDAKFVLDNLVYDLDIEIPSWWLKLLDGPIIYRFIGKLCRKFLLKKGKVFEENRSFVVDDALFKCNNFDGMSGYFQNPRYFEKNRNEILENIKFSLMTDRSIDFASIIAGDHISVSIHYRDYLDSGAGNEEVKKIMGEVETGYYLEAINLFNKKFDKVSFYVFSNNIQSAQIKFKDITNLIYFDYKSQVQWEDMVLMSMCHHNIICNSSYSWWSAYLNQNKDKIVITPKKWSEGMKNSNPSELGLFPIDWIQL
jgi:hypothetical protein